MERVLALGSGGATGVAWEAGVLVGLAAGPDGDGADGVDVLAADRIIGTSAGALVAAELLRCGVDELVTLANTPKPRITQMTAKVVARLIRAQVTPDRRAALVWLGQPGARAWTPQAEASWIDYAAADLAGMPWPQRLTVTATNIRTGRPTLFTAASGVELRRAVAASCAIPGIFPPVMIDGDLYMDGGMTTPGNLDLAAGADAVLAVVSWITAVRPYRWPWVQAAALRRGVGSGRPSRVTLIVPDVGSHIAQGPDMVDTRRAPEAFQAGVRQGRARAAEAARAWALG